MFTFGALTLACFGIRLLVFPLTESPVGDVGAWTSKALLISIPFALFAEMARVQG